MAHGLVEREVHTGPRLEALQVSLHGIPSSNTAQLGVICKRSERMLRISLFMSLMKILNSIGSVPM